MQPLPTLSFWGPWKGPIWIGLAFIITFINDSLLFNLFQPSVVFHIETAIWFALQIMPGFYLECYTGLKLVKRDYSLTQILQLSLTKCSKEILLTRPKAKIPSPSGGSPSNDKRLRNIRHSTSMALYTRFYIWLIITKFDRYCYKMWQLFYYRMWQKFITKCAWFFITRCDGFITKCDSY